MNSVEISPKTSIHSSGVNQTCPQWFTHGECKNGHRFVKEIYCGREWCPVCSKNMSAFHKRKVATWLVKAQKVECLGYFVFTIPEHYRSNYRTKRSLKELSDKLCNGNRGKSKAGTGILQRFGYDRGLAKWHWVGDKSNKYNPHLNVLVDGGWISPYKIELLKLYWSSLVGIHGCDVHYSYAETIPKMVHMVKYITRPTLTNIEGHEHLAAELYKFRNYKCWGKWDGSNAWYLRDNHNFSVVAKLEKSKCPVCGEKIKWNHILDIAWLINDRVELKVISAGYYFIDDG